MDLKVKFRFFFIMLVLFSPLGYAKERLHFLIPGGAGGGWDTTARGIGAALSTSGLIDVASFENISGGGGSKAMAYLIETAERQHSTLMISSTPIILNSLKGIFPQSYKDLVPVATAIADYGAFVVKVDSPYQNWQQMLDDYRIDPRNVKVAGGSVRGSMDHLVAALAFKKSGVDARQLRYIPYNAGAKAMVGLLSEETDMLSTGLSEAIALAEQGEVRILAMTAPQRVKYAPTIPTLVEQSVAVKFTNWRGFFAAPGVSEERLVYYHSLLSSMYKTSEWEEIRKRRGWSNLKITGSDFVDFLAEQELELEQVMVDLGMKP
ncbi:tripartite tricarboxylate transporter substrate-binding protein [Porticoccaceae bacterium]|nr:tripartite tricarboxylate transporter substrate-binding protein [Porticoccaceae bacterium]